MRLCSICYSPATSTCRICRRPVCSGHLAGGGICVLCADALCRVCGSRLAVATCPVCGRLICDECSVEVTKAVRVCRSCAARYHSVAVERSEAEAAKLSAWTSTIIAGLGEVKPPHGSVGQGSAPQRPTRSSK